MKLVDIERLVSNIVGEIAEGQERGNATRPPSRKPGAAATRSIGNGARACSPSWQR